MEAAAAAAALEDVDSATTTASSSKVDTRRVGVLLLNLGGPENLEDVRPFLYNLFSDPDILRTPLPFLQKPLGWAISTFRHKKSQEAYRSIGGGSPIRQITEAQASALEESLRKKGLVNAKVYIGMRYWHPYTDEAVEQMKKDGIEKIIMLPLYPQFSISTTGSSLRLLDVMMKDDSYLEKTKYTVVPSYPTRAGYVAAQAELISKELTKFPEPEKAHIFFSAHGVPRSYIEQAGDPYQKQIEECVSAIMRKLNVPNKYTLAYQSRVGPVEWLRPYTDEAIEELGKEGIKDLVVIPISFVSEHIETLEEIDQEYKELAHESGIERWARVPALDTNPSFIEDLADMVMESDAAPDISIHQAFDDVSLTVMKKIPLNTRPQTLTEWGFTKDAERWNGRLAMVASLLLIWEIVSGHLIFKPDV